MKILRSLAFAAALLAASPAMAQYQVQKNAVPIGKGGTVQGFGAAAPGATDTPLSSNGPGVDPSFRRLPCASLTNAAASCSVDTTNASNITSGSFGPARGGTGADNSINAAGDVLASVSANGNFATRALDAVCTLAPSVCTRMVGYTRVQWFGAKCDGVYQSSQNFDFASTTLSINSGSFTLTSTGSTFTSTAVDSGKVIWIPRAGPAAAGYKTTISTVVDPTHVTVAVAASSTIAGFVATNAEPFMYGTDDTNAIQATINGTPTGSRMRISGQRTGCIIRQQGANAYALLQNRPFSVEGDGHFSNLMTFPDTPSTVDNYFVDGTAGWDWAGLRWSGFSISAPNSFIPPTLLMRKRYGKRGLVFSDSAAANFVNVEISNMTIGESGNDYSLYIGNSSASPSQTFLIMHNEIFGGVKLDHVADSFRMEHNQLFGTSAFGGSYSFVGGAGKFEHSHNNVTWVGCTVVESGTMPSFWHNYFEELFASSCTNDAMLDFNGGVGTVIWPTAFDNIVGALVSTTSRPVRYSNVTGGSFGNNFISTSTVRTGVTGIAALNCGGPNFWNNVGTHFSAGPAAPNPFAPC